MIYTAEMMNPLFAFVDRLDGIEQSPIHHPEGCVLTHTMQVTNLAFRETIDTDLILAALLHDVGKYENSKRIDTSFTSIFNTPGETILRQFPLDFNVFVCCSVV